MSCRAYGAEVVRSFTWSVEFDPAMTLIDAMSAAGGIVLIGAILHDAFEVMLLPRRVKSRMRIVRYFFEGTWSLWSAIGRRIHGQDRCHHFLGLYWPLSLVLLVMVSATGLIVAFGTIYWALNPTQFSSHHWLNQV